MKNSIHKKIVGKKSIFKRSIRNNRNVYVHCRFQNNIYNIQNNNQYALSWHDETYFLFGY